MLLDEHVFTFFSARLNPEYFAVFSLFCEFQTNIFTHRIYWQLPVMDGAFIRDNKSIAIITTFTM